MNPELSIVVPVYNVDKYLTKCLESLINQTFENFEVICINDGSTDKSLEILNEFQKKDNRIKVFSQLNSGLGAARNAGMNKARGKYIGFIDSDDFADSTLFEKAIKSAKENDSDVVIFNVYLYYTDSCYKKVFRDTEFYSLLEKEGYFAGVEHARIINSIGVWDKLYRREFLTKKEIFNPENRIYEDVVFTIKAISLAKRISVISEPLIYYRKNTGVSIVDKEIINDYYKFDFLKNLKESKDFLKSIGLYTHFQRDFLFFQSMGLLFHQKNMQSKKNYLAFEKELSNILEPSDYEILRTFGFSEAHRGSERYFNRIKKKRFYTQLVCFKLRGLYSIDARHFSFRFPRTTKTFQIRRLGYYRAIRDDNQKRIGDELSRLNYNVETLIKELTKDKD